MSAVCLLTWKISYLFTFRQYISCSGKTRISGLNTEVCPCVHAQDGLSSSFLALVARSQLLRLAYKYGGKTLRGEREDCGTYDLLPYMYIKNLRWRRAPSKEKPYLPVSIMQKSRGSFAFLVSTGESWRPQRSSQSFEGERR